MVEAATLRSRVNETARVSEIVRGPRFWWRSYMQVFKWELLSLRLMLPLMIVLQILMGAGFAIGLGFLFADISAEQALFITTGSSVLPLLMIGFVIVPQQVAQQKLEGAYEFFFALPVSRMSMYLATMSVWSIVGLPAVVVALAAASWRYDLTLSVSPWSVPLAFLVVGVGTAIGFSLGHAIPNPRITNVITQVLVFGVFVFSPVNFPADRLPDWLAWVHQWLPAGHAASVMRWALTDGIVDDPTRALVTLLAWLVGAWLVAYAVITRRG